MQEVEYPSLLDMTSPIVQVYPQETFVAEKLESTVRLGMANSRMKDFYDLWSLSRDFAFEGQRLMEAVQATFQRRQTKLPKDTSVALTGEFGNNTEKATMWNAFLQRNNLETAGAMFPGVIQELGEFLLPVLSAASKGSVFESRWSPGGPWTKDR